MKVKLQQAAMQEKVELEQKLAQAQELLTAERQRLQALRASLDSEESPQMVAMKQKLQAQYEGELQTAKSTMAAEVKELNALLQEQTEAKLKDAFCRSVPQHAIYHGICPIVLSLYTCAIFLFV